LTEDGEPIALTVPMMGLVFMLCGDSCYVWATNFKIFNAEAPIYHVPLPNIYGLKSLFFAFTRIKAIA
jgi:hypothetical protein